MRELKQDAAELAGRDLPRALFSAIGLVVLVTVLIGAIGISGLRGGSNPIPTPQKDVTLRLRTQAKVRFLPFLGRVQEVRSTREGEAFVYHLPELQHGGVAWVEK